MTIEEKVLTLLGFGETNISEIWNYCHPSMPPTTSRKLRLLEEKGKIEACQFGKHGSKIAYRLIK